MNFAKPFEVLGPTDPTLVDNLIAEIKKINDDYYNYTDSDSVTGKTSWVRLDFDPAKVQHERETALWQAGLALIQDATLKYDLDALSSFSISMLKPEQVLEEHTDSRFIHRITNRYIIPLVDCGSSYNYWLVGPQKEKVYHYLKKGELFRVNNAIIHAAVNVGDMERFNLLIDTFDVRLKEKFGRSIDLAAPMSKEGFTFSVKRKSHNKYDIRLNSDPKWNYELIEKNTTKE